MIADLVTLLGAVSALETVEQAFTLTPVDELDATCPACYVLPLGDNAGGNELDNAVRQSLTTDWGLFLVCKVAELDAVRVAVRGALLGWQPTAASEQTTFVSGEIMDIKGEYLWWREVYRTTSYIRAT